MRAMADLGLTHLRDFRDPTARQMLRGGWALLFRALSHRAKPERASERGLQAGDVLALRTLILDAHVKDAVAAGAKQVVILGAGLDGRAYRLEELRESHVFEVDHPATQSFKLEAARGLHPTARRLDFVSVDFEKESLDHALERSGHRRDLPTAWLWEGVVMYLTDEAMNATLRTITARSAEGSRLAVQYTTPAEGWALRMTFFGLWGEPMIGLRTPEQMGAALASAGVKVLEDSGTADWAQRFGIAMPNFGPSRSTRVALAEVG